MKKILRLLLAVIMAFSIPCTAFASSATIKTILLFTWHKRCYMNKDEILKMSRADFPKEDFKEIYFVGKYHNNYKKVF